MCGCTHTDYIKIVLMTNTHVSGSNPTPCPSLKYYPPRKITTWVLSFINPLLKGFGLLFLNSFDGKSGWQEIMLYSKMRLLFLYMWLIKL